MYSIAFNTWDECKCEMSLHGGTGKSMQQLLLLGVQYISGSSETYLCSRGQALNTTLIVQLH